LKAENRCTRFAIGPAGAEGRLGSFSAGHDRQKTAKSGQS